MNSIDSDRENTQNLVSFIYNLLKVPTEGNINPNENHKKVIKQNLTNLTNLFKVYNNILSFVSHMQPTNLYLVTLTEMYIFGHFGPQMQAGILHSENHGLFCQNCYEITKNHLI